MNIHKPAAAAILVLSCCLANGQSFEVASIHRNLRGSQDQGINILPGGRISATSTTLKTLIRYAYKIQSFQLAGETGWTDSEYYDVEARAGVGETLSEEQLKPYLQSLLADDGSCGKSGKSAQPHCGGQDWIDWRVGFSGYVGDRACAGFRSSVDIHRRPGTTRPETGAAEGPVNMLVIDHAERPSEN